ncbi:atrial natriuretic peptide receptor 1-like [Tubulanus polymorphus]|uniref:atrial natriuretic peptide receptor 1-like n=1 Tax=Tubulanus polymorphus TaxID=672921 RepID=UPI003DA2D04E
MNVSLVFKIGVILISNSYSPYDMEKSGPAIDMAVDRVNRQYLNDSYRLETVKIIHGSVCDATRAPGIAADLYHRDHVVGLIGPACTYALEASASLAGYWNIPIITGLGDGGQFKNKTIYPTLTRMAYCQCRLRKVFGSVFSEFSWTKIALIYDRSHLHSSVLGETLDVGLRKGNIYPHVVQFYGSQQSSYKDLLKEASEHARVIVLSVSGDTVRAMMLEALDLGYINGDYTFMDVELFEFDGDYWGNHSWSRGDDRDQDAKRAFEALLRVALYEPNSEEFQNFSDEVKLRAERDYNYTFGDEKVNFFIGAFYDSVLLYGLSLNRSLTAGNAALIKDGYNFIRREMWNRTFVGITEDVFMDKNGDRDTSYSVLDMDPVSGKFRVVSNYWGDKPGFNAVPGVSIHWPGGRTSPPPDVPPCGFKNDNPLCQPEEKLLSLATTVTIVVLALCLFFTVVGFLIYKKMKYENELSNVSWLVKQDEILPMKVTNKMSSASLKSIKTQSEKQIYTAIASCRGTRVTVRNFEDRAVVLDREFMTEIKQV